MAQLPNGGLVRGHDKPIHGSCAIYFPGGINHCKHQLLIKWFMCCCVTLWNSECASMVQICRSIVIQADPKLQTDREFFLLFGGLFVENTNNNDDDMCCCCSWYCSSVFFVLVMRWRWRCWRRFRCRKHKELMKRWTMNLLVSLFKQSGRHLKHTQTWAWNMCRCLVPISVL